MADEPFKDDLPFLEKWPRLAKAKEGLTQLGQVLVHDEPKPVEPVPILGPGVHKDVPMAVYLQQPALSASVLVTTQMQCPFAGWYSSWLNNSGGRADQTEASDNGEIAHGLLLEGNMGRLQAIDPLDYPGERGGIPDGWTNKPIRAARDAAREAGKIPMLKKNVTVVKAMVESAQRYLHSVKGKQPEIWRMFFEPDHADRELSCLWVDDGGILCRIRTDIIHRDRFLIVDVKTSKRCVEPNSFARATFSPMGYRLRAAWYGSRGALHCFGKKARYVILAMEQVEPYLCSLIGFDMAQLALGEKHVTEAYDKWRECMQNGHWPAYPADIHYPELKRWEMDELEEWQGPTSSGDLPESYNFQRDGFPL